ncbi:Nucleoside recognition [Dethiosulfatibacter aminovorans DSM 17477]|uniref:Nucleoside recognition n=1 Tax=Dethiosulfatibacter aminovorans DSM 17477 TaxID=1121476 RepID=A0A1M6HZH6_9FIRM|nr:nucleoside recognition domain-containing protein [Dethiosulfatibacter aminovorans]SHJ27570.1 Nucleoside recognition [Dethiosulfatibacter aminovorans DSM 17477]
MEILTVLLTAVKNGIFSVLNLAKIIVPLMLAIEILKDLKILEKFSKFMSPLTKFLRIKEDASLPLIIGSILGLFFGAGVLFQSVQDGDLDKRSLVIISVFLALCHAVIEDTVIFVPIGASLPLVLSIRIVTAFIIAFAASRLIKEL